MKTQWQTIKTIISTSNQAREVFLSLINEEGTIVCAKFKQAALGWLHRNRVILSRIIKNGSGIRTYNYFGNVDVFAPAHLLYEDQAILEPTYMGLCSCLPVC